ncbi:hypothetical protein [Actinosynnema sp. NPDC020468]|uniref:hypothetical protein n=1 Tax=Actinosynnema sp. NPDC020468 TaxID=3154488 RepID=UPI003400BC04
MRTRNLAALLAFGALALVACTAQDQAAPTTTASPTTVSLGVEQPPKTTTAATATPVSAAPATDKAAVTTTTTVAAKPKSAVVLEPTGYGAIRLGMTVDQVPAGVLGAKVDEIGQCAAYQLTDGGRVVFGYPGEGAWRIIAPSAVRTAEGIGEGSTRAEVTSTYADAQEFRGGYTAHGLALWFEGADGNRASGIGVEKVSECSN